MSCPESTCRSDQELTGRTRVHREPLLGWRAWASAETAVIEEQYLEAESPERGRKRNPVCPIAGVPVEDNDGRVRLGTKEPAGQTNAVGCPERDCFDVVHAE
jgi:hypothetical protein